MFVAAAAVVVGVVAEVVGFVAVMAIFAVVVVVVVVVVELGGIKHLIFVVFLALYLFFCPLRLKSFCLAGLLAASLLSILQFRLLFFLS